MIAYRYQKKDNEWQWLQTSSRLVYKNSKPDFVICTHRQLMDEEGRDLLGKRTMDFKVNIVYKFLNQLSVYITYSTYRSATWIPDWLQHTFQSPTNSSFRQVVHQVHFPHLSLHNERHDDTKHNCVTFSRHVDQNANCNNNLDPWEL